MSIGVLLGLMLVACAGKSQTSPNAQSPERQSDAEFDIAVDLFRKGNARPALDHARKAVELNEENDRAQLFVSQILLSFCAGERGFDSPDCKLSESETYARQALKVNPQLRDATNVLGQVLINERKFKEAIVVLEPLTKDPAYIHPHFAWGNLGWAQIEDGQLDAGISSLRNAVTEPRFCVGHYRLGVGLERKGDLPAAEASLTSAVTADPQCEQLQDAWEARARVRLRLGKSAEARADYEKCVELSKDSKTGRKCEGEMKKLAPTAPAPSVHSRASRHPDGRPRDVGYETPANNDGNNDMRLT